MASKRDRQRPFERRKATREVERRIIIVCEGIKTETGYFKAIKTSLRLLTVEIIIDHAGATDPLNIVTHALKRREDYEKSNRWGTDDQV